MLAREAGLSPALSPARRCPGQEGPVPPSRHLGPRSRPLAGAHCCPSCAHGPSARRPRQPRACPAPAPLLWAQLQAQVGAHVGRAFRALRRTAVGGTCHRALLSRMGRLGTPSSRERPSRTRSLSVVTALPQADGQGRGGAAAHPGHLVGLRRAGRQPPDGGLPVHIRCPQLPAGRRPGGGVGAGGRASPGPSCLCGTSGRVPGRTRVILTLPLPSLSGLLHLPLPLSPELRGTCLGCRCSLRTGTERGQSRPARPVRGQVGAAGAALCQPLLSLPVAKQPPNLLSHGGPAGTQGCAGCGGQRRGDPGS